MGSAQIRVNALAPTVFRSDLTAWMYADDERGRATREAMLARIPLGRLAEPGDLVGALQFLLSDASAFLAGQVLYLDGGYTACWSEAPGPGQQDAHRPRNRPRRDGPGRRFHRAAVVGAGLMGRGIAAVLTAGGLDVMLCDVQPERLDESVAAARSAADASAGRGGEVGGSADLALAVRGADLVVEAVVEDLAVKRDVFAAVSVAAPDAVLATNTSVLPVTAIAGRAHRRERVLGTHWWNPPDLIPVVEVIPGRLTSAEVTGRVTLLLGYLGKTPVQVRRDVPGFIGNRLQHALGARRSPSSPTASATRTRSIWSPGTPSGSGSPGWARSRTRTTSGWT